jgi:hypothetical protein
MGIEDGLNALRISNGTRRSVEMFPRAGSGPDTVRYILRARMVESADTADLKSADPKGSWEFKSPSGHQSPQAL